MPDSVIDFHGIQFTLIYMTLNSGGLMIFIKQGVPLKRIKKFELGTAESICLEITISTRKWIMFSIYRPQRLI